MVKPPLFRNFSLLCRLQRLIRYCLGIYILERQATNHKSKAPKYKKTQLMGSLAPCHTHTHTHCYPISALVAFAFVWLLGKEKEREKRRKEGKSPYLLCLLLQDIRPNEAEFVVWYYMIPFSKFDCLRKEVAAS